MKVFISGPMRGYENNNYEMFMNAEEKLIAYGFSVFNPAWLQYDDKWDRKDMLEIDICALNKCDVICHLPGWHNASGAVLEDTYAQNASMPTLFFDGNDVFIVSKFIDNGKGMLKIDDIPHPIPSMKVRHRPDSYLYDFNKITELTKWIDEGLTFSEMAKRHMEKHHTTLSPETIKAQCIRYKLIGEEAVT